MHWYFMNNKNMYFFSNGLHRKCCMIIWEGLCVTLEEKKKKDSAEEKHSFSKRLIMDLTLYQLVHGTAIN